MGGLLLVQCDSAVAEGGDPAIHTGLVCKKDNREQESTITGKLKWDKGDKTEVFLLSQQIKCGVKSSGGRQHAPPG